MGKDGILAIISTNDRMINELHAFLNEHFELRVFQNREDLDNYLCEGFIPHLILLSTNPDFGSGYDIFRKIRNEHGWDTVPVVFLSDVPSLEDEEKGFSLGASDFLTMPFSHSKALARIRAHISLHEKSRKLKRSLKELQETQDFLLDSQKMSSVASLSAGVAHELNTPIGNVITLASSLTWKLDELEQKIADGTLTKSAMDNFLKSVRDAAGSISVSMEKASKLVRKMKSFSLQDFQEELQNIDLSALLRDFRNRIEEIHELSPPYIALDIPEKLTATSFPVILVGIMELLIENAIVHGLDGSKEGEGLILIQLKEAGDDVELTVADKGKGIAADVSERMFEPFFTTRNKEGFLGLGLSTVRNMVKQRLNGDVFYRVDEEGRTAITLRFLRFLDTQLWGAYR